MLLVLVLFGMSNGTQLAKSTVYGIEAESRCIEAGVRQSVGSDRVLARIFNMPVQNSNFKFSACPNLATPLLQILIPIPTTFNGLLCRKGQFTIQPCPIRCFFRKICI